MGHQELEVIWREKWMQAKLNLELAIIQFREIERKSTFDEDYRRSFRTLTVAVNEYSRVSQIYTDLTGKFPE